MSHRRTFAAAALAVAFVLPTITAHAAHELSLSSPSAASLKTSDVPHGFIVTSGAFVNNKLMAQRTKIPLKQFTQHGRISGYQQTFQGNNVKSYVSVVDNIYLYRAAAGAHWDYQHSIANFEKTSHMKPASAPRIGDESTGLAENTTVAKRPVTVYAISFRKGAVHADVGVSGYTGHVTMAEAVHYAKIVAGRIH